MLRPPPTSTLFPYTTLFRSLRPPAYRGRLNPRTRTRWLTAALERTAPTRSTPPPTAACRARTPDRSEEHTSELQSLTNLVCRLLLEKKKKKKKKHTNDDMNK